VARARTPFKVGVHEGGGPEPGYLWNVVIDDHAFEEAMSFLTTDQYCHLAKQVKELARQVNPRMSDTVDVDQVEDFFEIRDKGGILANINVRVFYGVDSERRNIIVLATWHKQNNAPTPQHIKLRVRRRLRLYYDSQD
jgi:hypothetical protein